MKNTTYTSAGGLTVSVPESELSGIVESVGAEKYLPYGDAGLTIEQRVRSVVLNSAGRAFKHRRALAEYYAQEIPEDDLQLARAIAVQSRRDGAIIAAAHELGCGEYVSRSAAGRPVNDAVLDRVIERSTARARDELDYLENQPLTLEDVDFGLSQLGYLVGADAEYSRHFVQPTWTITAPDGWNGQLSTAQEAIS